MGMGAGFMAVKEVSKVIEKDAAKLGEFREEHKAVAELTKRKASMVRAYNHVTDWTRLQCWRKAIISTAACAQVFSGFLFAMGGEYCFRSFSLNSRISDDHSDHGLDNNVWSIIRPAGYGALMLWVLGTFFHIVFALDTKRLARNYHKTQPPVDTDDH